MPLLTELFISRATSYKDAAPTVLKRLDRKSKKPNVNFVKQDKRPKTAL